MEHQTKYICYICEQPFHGNFVTLVQPSNYPIYLCHRCAGQFIDRLAIWKDIDLEKELLHYRNQQ